ncbi:GNAT family N-acetyltransferase (plasmid) [Haloarcula salina]|uniref:GNAT family N-acetyltransferase n=1 Tax=Haloarcula salina TaxID=1429914 RepID=UPI003C6F7005
MIRRFDEDDLDGLVEMYASLGAESRTMGIPPADEDALRRWLTAIVSDGWSLLATRDDRIVGHAAVIPEGDSEPEFVVFVLDGQRGRGIGTELVRQVLAYAEGRDHERLVLDVSPENERAITVYQNVGFETVERTGMSRTMELPLAKPVVEECQRPPADR